MKDYEQLENEMSDKVEELLERFNINVRDIIDVIRDRFDE